MKETEMPPVHAVKLVANSGNTVSRVERIGELSGGLTSPMHLMNKCVRYNIDGSAQDCSNSSALAMELLQSCAKPSIWGL